MLAALHLTVMNSGKPTDLVLQRAVTGVRSGSLIARLLLSYGAGKAVLNTNTTISTATGHAQVLLKRDEALIFHICFEALHLLRTKQPGLKAMCEDIGDVRYPAIIVR